MTTIDPVTIAGLVTREVRNGSRDGSPTKIAVARRTYATDREDLWAAVTEAERIPRWFLPVSGELRLGGRYQLEGNAGGVVERCDPPASFAVTWEMGPSISWLEVTLTPADEGTLLELAHEAHVDPELWGQYGPGAVGIGWDLALLGLGLHVDSGAPVDPELAATFLSTPEGAELVQITSAAWERASIAGGEDPDAARAAGERVAAAYTPAP